MELAGLTGSLFLHISFSDALSVESIVFYYATVFLASCLSVVDMREARLHCRPNVKVSEVVRQDLGRSRLRD